MGGVILQPHQKSTARGDGISPSWMLCYVARRDCRQVVDKEKEMKFSSYKNTGLIPEIDWDKAADLVEGFIAKFLGHIGLRIDDVFRLHACNLWVASDLNWKYYHRDDEMLRNMLEGITFRKPLKMDTRKRILLSPYVIAVMGWEEGNDDPTIIQPKYAAVPPGFIPVWYLCYERLGYVSSSD